MLTFSANEWKTLVDSPCTWTKRSEELDANQVRGSDSHGLALLGQESRLDFSLTVAGMPQKEIFKVSLPNLVRTFLFQFIVQSGNTLKIRL